MQFLKIMELAEDGDIIQNNYGTQFNVHVKDGDKILEVVLSSIIAGQSPAGYARARYAFMDPNYSWELAEKSWAITEVIPNVFENRNRYCVCVDQKIYNRKVHIIVYRDGILPTSGSTVVNGLASNFDEVVNKFIRYVRSHLEGNYKAIPSDYQEFYDLVKTIVSY